MEGGIGDLEIRPCTPPGRIIPAVGYVKHSRGLSAVTEQDEHADVEEPIVTPRASLERRLRTASNFVFRDYGGTTCEMLLSEHQERLLCELFDEENLYPSESTAIAGASQEVNPDGAIQFSSAALVVVRDDEGVAHDLFLSSSQTEAIWLSRDPDFEWTSSSAVRRCPRRVVEELKEIKPKSSSSSILPRLSVRRLIAKLYKKKRPAAGENGGVSYTSVWADNEFVAYVNGEQTMTSADLVPPNSLPTPSTRFTRASSAFLESSKGYRAVIKLALRGFKKVEGAPSVPRHHKPGCIIGIPAEEPKRDKHPILNKVKRILKRMDPFRPSPEPPLIAWDRRGGPPMVFNNSCDRVKNWLLNQDASTDPDNRVVALTRDELLRLKGASADIYQVIMPEYHVPPPSHGVSVTGDAVETGEGCQNVFQDEAQGGGQDGVQDEVHDEVGDGAQESTQGADQDTVQEAASTNAEETKAEEEETIIELRRVLLAARNPQGEFGFESGREARFKYYMAKDMAAKKRKEAAAKELAAKQEQASNSTAETPAQPEQNSSARTDNSASKQGDDEYAREHELKDLRHVPKPYYGFYIAAPVSGQSIVEVHDNYSDYYQLPLVDPRAGSRLILGTQLGHHRQETTFSEEYNPEDYIPDDEIPDDEIPNYVHPPRSQVPAQAIILHLLFKGYAIDDIANELSLLDTDFLYKNESRWWKRTRVPELWQLNEPIIDDVVRVARAGRQWWEADRDRQDRPMPPAMRIIQRRMRVRNVIRLARKSVENYFWWRLTGERIHCDIPCGHVIREFDC